MNRYEFQRRLEEGEDLIADGNYAGAVKLFDTMNLDLIDQPRELQSIAKAYEKCRRYADAEEILLQARDAAPKSRSTLFHLCSVAIKAGETESAKQYYEDFVRVAKYDSERFVLRYRIAQAEGASDEVLIGILTEYKDEEPDDRWMFELAKLYAKNGRNEEALAVCDEVELWFYSGKYVRLTRELHARLDGSYVPEEEEEEEVVPEVISVTRPRKETAEIAVPEDTEKQEETVNAREDYTSSYGAPKAKAAQHPAAEEAPKPAVPAHAYEKPEVIQQTARIDAIPDGTDRIYAQPKAMEPVTEYTQPEIRMPDFTELGLTQKIITEAGKATGDLEFDDGFTFTMDAGVFSAEPEKAEEEFTVPDLEAPEEKPAEPELPYLDDDPNEVTIVMKTPDIEEAIEKAEAPTAPEAKEQESESIYEEEPEITPEKEAARAALKAKMEEVATPEAWKHIILTAQDAIKKTDDSLPVSEREDIREVANEQPEVYTGFESAPEVSGSPLIGETVIDLPDTEEAPEEIPPEAEEEAPEPPDLSFTFPDDVDTIEAEIEKRMKDSVFFGNLPVEPEMSKEIWHFMVFGDTNALTLEYAREIMTQIGEENPSCPAKLLKISAEKIGSAGIVNSLDRFLGNMVIVEQAASLSDSQLREFAKVLEKDDRSLLVAFTDSRNDMIRMFERVPALADSFTAVYEGKKYNARDLVNTAKEYLFAQEAKVTREAEGVLYEYARFLLSEKKGFYKNDIRRYAEEALSYADKGGLFRLSSGKIDDDGYLIITEKHFKKAEGR